MTNKPETVRADEIFENDMDGLVYKKNSQKPFTGMSITERITDNLFDLYTVINRENYKHGRPDGLFEYYYENDQLEK